jgi:hypothetical protein
MNGCVDLDLRHWDVHSAIDDKLRASWYPSAT